MKSCAKAIKAGLKPTCRALPTDVQPPRPCSSGGRWQLADSSQAGRHHQGEGAALGGRLVLPPSSQSIPGSHDCRHAGSARFHPGHLSCPPRPCPLRRHRHRRSSSPSTKVARSCSSSTATAGCCASRSSQAWRKSGSACRHAHAHIRAPARLHLHKMHVHTLS